MFASMFGKSITVYEEYVDEWLYNCYDVLVCTSLSFCFDVLLHTLRAY